MTGRRTVNQSAALEVEGDMSLSGDSTLYANSNHSSSITVGGDLTIATAGRSTLQYGSMRV